MKPINEETEVKINYCRISSDLYSIICRLQEGKTVDTSDIMNTSEFKLAEQVRSNMRGTNTMFSDQAYRSTLRSGISKKMFGLGPYCGRDANGNPVYEGEMKYGKMLHIVIGFPVSVELSDMVNILSERFGARPLCDYMIRDMIPESVNGWSAGADEEAGKIMEEIAVESVMGGCNIVTTMSDLPENMMSRIIESAKEQGNEIYVHMIDVDPNKEIARMLIRFVEDGDYVDPKILEAIRNDPQIMIRKYEHLKKSETLAGYYLWDANAGFGEAPILTEWSDNLSDTEFVKEHTK